MNTSLAGLCEDGRNWLAPSAGRAPGWRSVQSRRARRGRPQGCAGGRPAQVCWVRVQPRGPTFLNCLLSLKPRHPYSINEENSPGRPGTAVGIKRNPRHESALKTIHTKSYYSFSLPREAASVSHSNPSINQLVSLPAAPRTQSFLSRKITPTKNISIFQRTVAGIPGTPDKDEKKCVCSIEACVRLQKDASTHRTDCRMRGTAAPSAPAGTEAGAASAGPPVTQPNTRGQGVQASPSRLPSRAP